MISAAYVSHARGSGNCSNHKLKKQTYKQKHDFWPSLSNAEEFQESIRYV